MDLCLRIKTAMRGKEYDKSAVNFNPNGNGSHTYKILIDYYIFLNSIKIEFNGY